jgi:hypothetical protein
MIFAMPFSIIVTATILKIISKGVNSSELRTKKISVPKKPVAI